MAKSRTEQGAEIRRGVLSVPRGTIESVQFCKNGVVRIAREARSSVVRLERRSGHGRGL